MVFGKGGAGEGSGRGARRSSSVIYKLLRMLDSGPWAQKGVI